MPDELHRLYSEDKVKVGTLEDGMHLPIEHLNTINVSDLPPHELLLKENSIVTLIRNLDVEEGLCNGTRMRVIKIHKHLLECELLSGNILYFVGFKTSIFLGDFKGNKAHIPRIIMESNKGVPCTIQRIQFPVKLVFL